MFCMVFLALLARVLMVLSMLLKGTFNVANRDVYGMLRAVAVKDCVKEEGELRLSSSSIMCCGQLWTVELEHASAVCLCVLVLTRVFRNTNMWYVEERCGCGEVVVDVEGSACNNFLDVAGRFSFRCY
jgi:hypothetical protein